MHRRPQEGAGETTPRSETVTAAEHLPESTGAAEAAETTNTTTGTAAIIEIGGKIETERRVTDTTTEEIEGIVGIPTTETKDSCHE